MRKHRQKYIHLGFLSLIIILCLSISFGCLLLFQSTKNQQNLNITQVTLVTNEIDADIQALYEQLETLYPIQITNKTEFFIDNNVISDKVKDNFIKTTDNNRIYQTLLAIDESFSLFPAEFWEYFKKENEKLFILIAQPSKDNTKFDGHSIKNDSNKNFAKYSIVLYPIDIEDITPKVTTTHETFHIVQYICEENFSFSYKDIITKWNQLNPKNFEYREGIDNNDFYENEYHTYFFRPYGTTSLNEDISTIAECWHKEKVFNSSVSIWPEKEALLDEMLKLFANK